MKAFTTYAALAAVMAMVSACDSKEALKKRDDQALELTKLKAELAIIEEQIKDVPEDRTKELAAIEEETKAQEAEITKLEGEIKDLETRKATVQKEFDDYKKKYVVR